MTHTPPLILLIDDDKAFLAAMTPLLEKDGYAVITAENGEEAFKKTGESLPDLVLLDVEMPGMNGAEVFENFKSDPALKDIKVAFLTNYGQAEDQKFAKEVGARAYIKKSDNPEVMLAGVREALEK